jgi:hypothetical protein
MIDKPPKIINENSAEKSKKIARKEIDKSLGILSGELPPVDEVETEKEEPVLLEVDSSMDMEKEKAKEDESTPGKGGTWHDDYDNY